jgi:hypothetical protein
VKSGDDLLLDWSGPQRKRSVSLNLKKNVPYPIEIIYNHEGGDSGYLIINWFKLDQANRESPTIQFFHSPAQKQKMDRITMLREN